MQDQSIPPPVLILGCGRSGTSIFGELFQGLDGYDYQSEPLFSDMLKSFGHGIAVKVPKESNQFEADAGLSIPIEYLLERVPETRIFWIVRHPLDTVCSLRIGIGNDWGHHPRPLDWRLWLHRPLIERCAHHWVYINSLGFDAVKGKATLVRFEDMVRAPSRFASSILSKIGLAEEQNKASLQRWSDRIQDTNNEKFVEALTSQNYSRPDHSIRVGRWRENLTIEEAERIVDMVSQTNRRFGYDLGVKGT